MDEMTEIIAEARAEEEARKRAIEEKLKETKEETIASMGKVSVDLNEYIALCQDSVDLRRLIEAIKESLGLYKWSGELRVEKDELIINTMTVLYRDFMDGVKADILDKYEKEEEERKEREFDEALDSIEGEDEE